MATMTGTNLLESIIESTGAEVNDLIRATLSAKLQQMIDNGTYSKLAASIAMSGFSTTINAATELNELSDAVEVNAGLIEAAADQDAVDLIEFPPVGSVVEPITFTLTAGADTINEGEANTFTVTASDAVTEDTVVTFQLSISEEGDSAQLEDFNAGAFNPVEVTIPAGETEATFDLSTISADGTELSEKYSVLASVNGEALTPVQVTILDGSVGAGQTFQLTKDLDLIPGMTGSNGNTVTSGDDTIIGVTDSDTAANSTLNATDLINAGEGTDTLKVVAVGAGNTTVATNFEGVEIVEVQSSETGSLTVNTTTATGVTDLNITKAAGVIDADAAATTDIDVSMKAAGAAIAVDGGNDLNVALTDVAGTADAVTVGAATAAKGDVTVEMTGKATTAATDATLSAVTVKGGKTVTVTQSATSDDSAAAADTTGATITQGAIKAVADASTTEVVIKQDAAQAKVVSVPAVTGVAATQELTFTKADAGDTITLTFDTNNTSGTSTLVFTAKKALTANEVAAAFANLVNGDVQGHASAANGVYTNTATGVSEGWTSGDVVEVSSTQAKVVFSSSYPAASTDAITAAVTGTATVTGGGSLKTTATDAVVGKTGVLGIAAGAVDIDDTASNTLTTITVDAYGAGSAIGAADATATENLATLNLSNGGTADMTVDNTADTLALTVESLGSAGGDAILTFTNAPLTLNVQSTGDNYVNLTAAATETLNVSGTGLLDVDGADLAGLKTVVVTETAGLKLNGGENDTLESVNTTGTTGAVTATINGDKATYTGGAGVDSVTVANPDTAISKDINLGAGDDRLDLSGATPATPTKVMEGGDDSDTLVLAANDAASLSAASSFEGWINGFEKLDVAVLGAANKTVNLDNLDDINYVITNGDGGNDNGLTLDKMLNNATVELVGDHSTSTTQSGVTVKLADSDGTADEVNLVTNAATGTDIGQVTVDGVETISIEVNDTDPTIAVSANTLALDADKAATINVEGAGNLTLTLSADTKAVTLVDASTMTGALTLATIASDDAATTVNGGEGNDVLTAKGANDVLNGGDGADTLKVDGAVASAVTLTGGAGTDSFDLSTFTAANAGSAVTITDFTAGETIKFVTDATADFNSAKVQLIEEATFTEYVTEAGAQAGGQYGIAWFQFNNNTFIVQDVDANAGFTDGADIIVKLTGLVELGDSSFNAALQGTLEFV